MYEYTALLGTPTQDTTCPYMPKLNLSNQYTCTSHLHWKQELSRAVQAPNKAFMTSLLSHRSFPTIRKPKYCLN